MKLFCISSKNNFIIEDVINMIEQNNIEQLKEVLKTNFITSNYHKIIDKIIELNKVEQFTLITNEIKLKNKYEIGLEKCCNHSNYTISSKIMEKQININFKNDSIIKKALQNEDRLMISMIFENFEKRKFIPYYEELLIISLKLNIVTIVDFILNSDTNLSNKSLLFALSHENDVEIIKKLTFFKIPVKFKTFFFNYCFCNDINDFSIVQHFISNEIIISTLNNCETNKIIYLCKNKLKQITSYNLVIYLISHDLYDILTLYLRNNLIKHNSLKLKQLNRNISDSNIQNLLNYNKNNFNQGINDMLLHLICVKNKSKYLKYLNLSKLTNSFETFDYPISGDLVKKIISLQISLSLNSLVYLLNQAIFNNLFNSYYTIQLRIPNELKRNIQIKYCPSNEQIIMSMLTNGFDLEEIIPSLIVYIRNISINIDLIEKYNFTPTFDDLIIYITKNKSDIVEYLIDSERICTYDYNGLFELACKHNKINIIRLLAELDIDVSFNDYKGVCHLIVTNEIETLKLLKQNYDMNDFCDLIIRQDVSNEIKNIFKKTDVMKISSEKIKKCKNDEGDLLCMMSYGSIKVGDYFYYCNNDHIFLENEWNKWLEMGKENLCIYCYAEVSCKVYKMIK